MKKSAPLVSICVPAYNHEMYVQACIQSIIEQDYDNIELLVIDDGSSDNTWEKIRELVPLCEKRFVRFVAQRQENAGAAETLLRLHEMSRGAFSGDIASDDQYLPGAVSALVEPMLNDPSIGLVVGVNELMDSDGRTCYWDKDRNIVYNDAAAAYKTFTDYVEHCARIDFDSADFGSYKELIKDNHVPNGSIRRNGIYRHWVPTDHGPILEDWWFHLQFSKVSKYRAIRRHTFRYRWHATNTMKNREAIARMVLATQLCEMDLLSLPSNSRWRNIAKSSLRIVHVKWHLWKLFVWTVDTIDYFSLCVGFMRWPIVLYKRAK